MWTRAKIIGTGAYVPPRVVKNDELRKFMDTSDEWIRERSGIVERRYADAGVNTSDLALEASRKALQSAGMEAEDIDCIILATLSPDHQFPGTAIFLQHKLGISNRGCACYDVRAQCSGFLYATELSRVFIETGTYRKILAVGAEIHSSILEFADRGRGLTVLFGDGAAAVVLRGAETERPDDGVFYTEVHADGGGAFNGVHQKMYDMSHKPCIDYDVTDPARNVDFFPDMCNPRALFVNGVVRMSEVTQHALSKNGLTVADVDWVLPHQANIHIIRDVADRLKLPKEKMLVNIDKYGNTSAATIPLLLDEFARNGTIKRGDLLACTSFGSGYTWGAALIRY